MTARTGWDSNILATSLLTIRSQEINSCALLRQRSMATTLFCTAFNWRHTSRPTCPPPPVTISTLSSPGVSKLCVIAPKRSIGELTGIGGRNWYAGHALGELLPEGGVASREEGVFARVPAEEMRSFGVKAMMFTGGPDFMEEESAGRFD